MDRIIARNANSVKWQGGADGIDEAKRVAGCFVGVQQAKEDPPARASG